MQRLHQALHGLFQTLEALAIAGELHVLVLKEPAQKPARRFPDFHHGFAVSDNLYELGEQQALGNIPKAVFPFAVELAVEDSFHVFHFQKHAVKADGRLAGILFHELRSFLSRFFPESFFFLSGNNNKLLFGLAPVFGFLLFARPVCVSPEMLIPFGIFLGESPLVHHGFNPWRTGNPHVLEIEMDFTALDVQSTYGVRPDSVEHENLAISVSLQKEIDFRGLKAPSRFARNVDKTLAGFATQELLEIQRGFLFELFGAVAHNVLVGSVDASHVMADNVSQQPFLLFAQIAELFIVRQEKALFPNRDGAFLMLNEVSLLHE